MSGRAACVTTVCDAMRGWSVVSLRSIARARVRVRLRFAVLCGIFNSGKHIYYGPRCAGYSPSTHQLVRRYLDVGLIACPCSTDIFEARVAIMGPR